MSKRNTLTGLFAFIHRPASRRLQTSVVFCSLALLPCLTRTSSAQAVPVAEQPARIDIFGGYTLTKPDYTENWSNGGFVGGDYLLRQFVFGRPGVQIRYSKVSGSASESFFGGGLDLHYHFHRLSPYIAALYGVGGINVHSINYSDSGNEFQIGGGADYPILRHFSVRAEYMYGFLSISGSAQAPNSGISLTPSNINLGLVYHLR